MNEKLKHVQDILDALAGEVRGGSFGHEHPPRITGWRRAGVLFATEVPDMEKIPEGRRRPPLTVLTPHAQEAGWLLDRLSEAFGPLMDRCIEQDFYERIAEAALEYCAYVEPEDSTDVNLLKIILSEAADILEEMRDGEFPYVTG